MRYALIALLLLSGCALREQIIADRIMAKGPLCEKMGYTPNTDSFRDCQIRLYQADEAGVAVLVR